MLSALFAVLVMTFQLRARRRHCPLAKIREQILYPCLLLASGLRDYEIKLDQRISAARESLQLFLFGN
jgi:hypothetical protein